jgi:two-component system chemotaxis response regulator CheB
MMATRVLVCDDSPLLRRVITDILTEGRMEVVGQARDGLELVARAKELRPDVITLDVEMPRRNGLDGLRALMSECPTPVVMVSSLTGAGTAATADALASGAVDAVCTPATLLSAAGWGRARDDLLRAVRAAARVVPAAGGAPGSARPGGALAGRAGSAAGPLVVIACSTGGPRALQAVVPRLPSPLGAGVLIVQHMPVGFTGSLARRLDEDSALTVREAASGDAIAPGVALIARAGWHLEVSARDRVRLSHSPPVGALRPRADVTIESAVPHFGSGLVTVVLTGMGDDGVAGCAAVRRSGGRVLAEAQSSAVVWGMPGAVVGAGHADAVLPLDAMPLAITEAVAATRAR